MKTPFQIIPVLFCAALFAAGPAKITNVSDALAKSKEGNKMLFLQYGRENCGNCQALKALIKGGKIHLSSTKFVYADVNCDDPATRKAFAEKFKVSGNTLPFVVIASADGTQLAARSGYGSEAEYSKFIHEAEKAAKK
ncbi:MAG: hypothetical protein WCN98_09115 [Verrucomicrobiaceae bacterium]